MRGAGIFGLSIAWDAVRRGARVRVVDPFGVGAGSSGGIVGALAPHTPDAWNAKKQFQFDSLIMADAFWSDVAAVSGLSTGYGRSGRLQPVADARAADLARERGKAAVETWGGAAVWEVVEAGAASWCPSSPTGLYVRDTLSARLHPRRACESLAAAITMRGGQIAREASDEGNVVWASGWQGLADLSASLGRAVGNGVKGQAILLRHHAPPDAPQVFAGGIHVVPHDDGTVAIGSTSERDFDAPDTTDHQADALLEAATAAMPILHGADIVSRWASVRPRAKTRSPMLGHWPGRPGHYVANGGFKIGFGIAPKVAAVMADLVLEGRDAIPEGFRVEDNL